MRGDPDPDKQDIYYTTHSRGEGAGCYRMTINREARTFEPDKDWAENGLAPVGAPGIAIMQMEVWKNNLVAANWSRADVPASSVEFWDKGSGEVVKSLDVAEWFTNFWVDDDNNEVANASGPSALSVHEEGIYLSGWTSPNLIKIDHDGNTIWVNRNGDVVGDQVSCELMLETGMYIDWSTTSRFNADLSGKVSYFSLGSNNGDDNYGAIGRDGAGIFNIRAEPSIVGPYDSSLSTFITIIDRGRSTSGSSSTWDGPNPGERGPWDGMYWDSKFDITRHSLEHIEGQKFGAGMLLHIPYDLVSGRLDLATGMEAVDRASIPDNYSLGAAYPNPFNPEATIEFEVPAQGFVQIDVFNPVGQIVASLVSEELRAGSYSTHLEWARPARRAGVERGLLLPHAGRRFHRDPFDYLAEISSITRVAVPCAEGWIAESIPFVYADLNSTTDRVRKRYLPLFETAQSLSASQRCHPRFARDRPNPLKEGALKMPRILVAECKQEISSFNPVPSHYEDFRIVRGGGMLDYHRGVGEEVGGALSVFEAEGGVEVVPGMGASSRTSGGVLTAAGFGRLSREFLDSLVDAGSVDAAYFGPARSHAGRERKRPRGVPAAGGAPHPR